MENGEMEKELNDLLHIHIITPESIILTNFFGVPFVDETIIQYFLYFFLNHQVYSYHQQFFQKHYVIHQPKYNL